MRIAIVNDMAEKSEKMETALKSLGKELALELEVTCFSSGEAFLAAFESGSFDIVFMDIYMNGISVTETAFTRSLAEYERFLLINKGVLVNMDNIYSHLI